MRDWWKQIEAWWKEILRQWRTKADVIKPKPARKYVYFDDPSCAGYGAVNFWHRLDPKAQAEAIADRGLDVYHIELLGWAGSRISPDQAREPYRKLLSECRKRKVVLFTSIFNDNSHLAKYDNSPYKPSYAELHKCTQFILSEGAEGQIIQPTGETQTGVGKRLQNDDGYILKDAGFKICWNQGSRPSAPPAGWDFAAYHPTSTGVTIPSGAVCVTDTGQILRQMGGYSQFNASAVESYANQCLNGWRRPCILYGFLHQAIDTAALDALSRVKNQ